MTTCDCYISHALLPHAKTFDVRFVIQKQIYIVCCIVSHAFGLQTESVR